MTVDRPSLAGTLAPERLSDCPSPIKAVASRGASIHADAWPSRHLAMCALQALGSLGAQCSTSPCVREGFFFFAHDNRRLVRGMISASLLLDSCPVARATWRLMA
jgi:hypothetical protein